LGALSDGTIGFSMKNAFYEFFSKNLSPWRVKSVECALVLKRSKVKDKVEGVWYNLMTEDIDFQMPKITMKDHLPIGEALLCV
jgi:hypothetical protein